ncbi:MAG: sigma 54-interacting transcriptional regulator [Desulfovibrio sp.]
MDTRIANSVSLPLRSLPFPALLCDQDGIIIDGNDQGRALAGYLLGKHAARLDPALGDLLNGHHLRRAALPAVSVGLGGRLYGVSLVGEASGRAVLLFQPVPEDRELQTTLHQYVTAFDNATDGMWIVSGAGVVQAINASSEKLNGVRARQVVGRNIHDLLGSGLMDKSATVEVLKRNRETSFIQQVSPSGKHLHVTGTPSHDENGEIAFVVVVEKDVTDLKHMRSTVKETRKARDKARDELTELTLLQEGSPDIVAESPAMRGVLNAALKLARLETQSVMLAGEPGTGRHSLARFIHRQGPRQGGPFISVNCAGLPMGLQEAELFGYEKNAIPGIAGKEKAGMLALAEGGTFLLDDIAALPLQAQTNLLRCLDAREFLPRGARKPLRLDCSIIVTAGQDLERLVMRGLFREDLYHRLNMFCLRIPPLRERPEDIAPLARIFLGQANAALGTQLELSPRALHLLQGHALPGNAHELDGLIRKAAALCENGVLADTLEELLRVIESGPASLLREASLPDRLEALEREILLRARLSCATTREMAEMLGISQAGVVRKLRRHGI